MFSNILTGSYQASHFSTAFQRGDERMEPEIISSSLVVGRTKSVHRLEHRFVGNAIVVVTEKCEDFRYETFRWNVNCAQRAGDRVYCRRMCDGVVCATL
jgi:hypothetical protein